jgi:hypothetical protein
MPRTVNVPVKMCLGCAKVYKKIVKRDCDRCMVKMECLSREVPKCAHVCNKCWKAYVNVARALHYTGLRDDWDKI